MKDSANIAIKQITKNLKSLSGHDLYFVPVRYSIFDKTTGARIIGITAYILSINNYTGQRQCSDNS